MTELHTLRAQSCHFTSPTSHLTSPRHRHWSARVHVCVCVCVVCRVVCVAVCTYKAKEQLHIHSKAYMGRLAYMAYIPDVVWLYAVLVDSIEGQRRRPPTDEPRHR